MPPRRPADSVPDSAIVVQGLRKVYDSRNGVSQEALKGIDLEIPRGSFFGLLGPNGAGKSTLINILAGLVVKTGGKVLIWGHDIDVDARRARQYIGAVPQELNLDPFFAARETLEAQAGYHGVPKRMRRTEELLAVMGLSEQAETYPRALSGGMRRRLMVAKALVHAPPVVVLDEPTAGVDVELRRQIWDYMRRLNAAGTTVLLTTHYLDEAERLCDRIAIIHRGQVVACERTPELLGRLDQKELAIIISEDVDCVPAAFAQFETELETPRQIVVRYRPSETEIGEILAAARRSNLTILDLSTKESDLEDIFLHLTRGAGDE